MSRIETVWDWPAIKAEVERKGTTLGAIADSLGVTPQAISTVRSTRSARIEAAIAKVIGVPPKLLWPARYGRDGHPLPRRRRAA